MSGIKNTEYRIQRSERLPHEKRERTLKRRQETGNRDSDFQRYLHGVQRDGSEEELGE